MELFFQKKETDPAILKSLESEYREDSKQLAWVRFLFSFVWILLILYNGFYKGLKEWVDGFPYVFTYFSISIFFLYTTHQKNYFENLAKWAPSFCDIPLIFMAMKVGIESGSETAYPLAASMFTMCIFILFILFSPTGVNHLHTYISSLESFIFTYI